MYPLAAQDWSPTTWALLFSCVAVCALALFTTFAMVLVRAAARDDMPSPSRPALVGSDAASDLGDEDTSGHHHRLHWPHRHDRHHPHAA